MYTVFFRPGRIFKRAKKGYSQDFHHFPEENSLYERLKHFLSIFFQRGNTGRIYISELFRPVFRTPVNLFRENLPPSARENMYKFIIGTLSRSSVGLKRVNVSIIRVSARSAPVGLTIMWSQIGTFKYLNWKWNLIWSEIVRVRQGAPAFKLGVFWPLWGVK